MAHTHAGDISGHVMPCYASSSSSLTISPHATSVHAALPYYLLAFTEGVVV